MIYILPARGVTVQFPLYGGKLTDTTYDTSVRYVSVSTDNLNCTISPSLNILGYIAISSLSIVTGSIVLSVVVIATKNIVISNTINIVSI
jgi:hypothetical protein